MINEQTSSQPNNQQHNVKMSPPPNCPEIQDFLDKLKSGQVKFIC